MNLFINGGCGFTLPSPSLSPWIIRGYLHEDVVVDLSGNLAACFTSP